MKKTLPKCLILFSLVGIFWQPQANISQTESEIFAVHASEADQAIVPIIRRFLQQGTETVEQFFGKPFPQKFTVRIFPNRAALDKHWSEAWNMPGLKTECWMVASGTARELTILSPNVWPKEACEHDFADTLKTQMLLTHELTHVYHGQHNPQPEFAGLDDIGWFLEGLAVLASGQLDGGHMASAREAIELGHAPKALKHAWSGTYRYGVSGSLVQYLDKHFGRKKIIALLGGTSEKEILAALNLTEQELLTQWQLAVSGGHRQHQH